MTKMLHSQSPPSLPSARFLCSPSRSSATRCTSAIKPMACGLDLPWTIPPKPPLPALSTRRCRQSRRSAKTTATPSSDSSSSVYALYWASRGQTQQVENKAEFLWQKFPKFVLGFLLISLLATAGLFHQAELTNLANLSRWAFLLTFAGVGLADQPSPVIEAGLASLRGGRIGEIAIAVITRDCLRSRPHLPPLEVTANKEDLSFQRSFSTSHRIVNRNHHWVPLNSPQKQKARYRDEPLLCFNIHFARVLQ